MGGETMMTPAQALSFGPYRLPGPHGPLLSASGEVWLRPKSAAVLWQLASRPGELLSKEELIAAVWPQASVSDGALVVCVCELRQALGDPARAPRYIQTIYWRGYRFIAPLTTTADSARARGPRVRPFPTSHTRLAWQEFDPL
jgi:DNA-binding winged helix-turn-helix (wHTH) protein